MLQLKHAMLLLFIVILFEKSKAKSHPRMCDSSSPEVGIDWNRVKPIWYLAVHTPDEIFSHVVGCQILSHFKAEGNKLECQLKNYFRNKSLAPMKFRGSGKADGKSTYIIHIEAYPSVIAESEVADTKLDAKAVKQSLSFEESRMVTLTDYDTYFIFIVCSEMGEDHVLAYTTTPNPSTGELMKIRDAVYEAHGKTILEKSNCAATDFSVEDKRGPK